MFALFVCVCLKLYMNVAAFSSPTILASDFILDSSLLSLPDVAE